MKRSDIKQLHELTQKELEEKLEALVKEMVTARLEKMANKLDDVKKLSKLRDDVARIKTVLAEKSKQEVTK